MMMWMECWGIPGPVLPGPLHERHRLQREDIRSPTSAETASGIQRMEHESHVDDRLSGEV
jgi:hypothetical protein